MELHVNFPARLARRFKQDAKKAMPKEDYAILLGCHFANGDYDIEELYFPKDRFENATSQYVTVLDEWWDEAREEARALGLQVLGDLHSHPNYYPCDCGPSELDMDQCVNIKSTKGVRPIYGICAITKNKGKRWVARIRFWQSASVVTNIV